MFLLTKSPKYYFDLDDIRIPHKGQAAEPFNRRARDAMTGRGMGADMRDGTRVYDATEYDAAGHKKQSDTRQVCLDDADQTAADPRVLRALQRRSVRYDARVGDGDQAIVPARAQPMRTTNRIPGNPSDNPAMLKADGTPFNHPAGKNPGDVVALPGDRPQPIRTYNGSSSDPNREGNDPRGKNPGDVQAAEPDITPKAVQTIRDHYGDKHPDGTPINHPGGKNPGDFVELPGDRAQPLRCHTAGTHPDGRTMYSDGGKNPGDVQAFRPQPLRVNMTTHDGRQVNANGEPYEDPRGKNPGDVQEFRRTFSNHGEFVHVATFPESLAAWCLRAGCPKGGMVLDPFFGVRHGRRGRRKAGAGMVRH